ncbi:MAG: NYN domain-containing protein [marine benthic group bacterium]|jgi:uncharacterized protein (TIGR00288 family)|nr:NYN domain-containing protein [Gemmatimonadota bacterium]
MNEHYTHAPHRRPGAEEQFSNAALLIDFDNVTMGTRSNLGQELRKLLNSDIIKGKVAVQRAYADWRRYPQYIVSLSESSIDLIFAPAYGSSKKNATDIRLAIDALELVFTRPEIGTYILLSGDSDFSSLVLKLKEYGKYVIGVGMQESSSDLLVQNCDEYYSYNSISGLTSAADGPTEKHDPWVLAGRTILKMQERKDVMRSDRFKQVMLELDPSFDEKEIGFSKFNRFLSEAASRGILSLEKAANGQYEVAAGSRATAMATGDGAVSAAGDADGSAEPMRVPEKRSRSRSRGSRRSSERKSTATTQAPPAEEEAPDVDADRLRSAYALLAEVTGTLASPGNPVRDSEVKRRMLEQERKFDEAALGFSKFSRFLRQAHDEGIVDLERGPEGNYLVSPNPEGSATVGPAARTDSEPEAPGKEPARERRTGRGRRSRSEERSADRDKAPRGRSSRGRPAEEKAPRESEAEPEAAAAPQAEPDSGAESPAADSTPSSQPATDEAVEESKDSSSGPEPRRSVGMGRFRRGSRSKGSTPAGGTGSSTRNKVVPGPVDATESTPTPRPETSRTERPARERRRPTTTSSSDTGEDTSRFRSEIEAMSRNYPGVGRRTAEVLFREFGDGVFEVIDSQPDRIRAVLPEHRAKAVLAGRKAELGD